MDPSNQPMISPHFSMAEMTTSKHADADPYGNQPQSDDVKTNMALLCFNIMEEVRDLLGAPINVNSGYRSQTVNTLAHGDKHSAHMDGRACDFFPMGKDLDESFNKIRTSNIPYDKVIIEQSGVVRWIHIQIAKPGATPRKLAYTACVDPKTYKTIYKEVK